MAKGRTSIRDVARESGVSLTTVSLVLNNNDERISEATRSRVLQAMRELDYTPSRLARGLPNRRANTLAVLVPAIHHAFADVYFGEIISGIYEAASDKGYRMLLEVARREYVLRREYLTILDDCSVDGILFIGATEEHTWLEDFHDAGRPLMVVNTRFDRWNLNSVVCDYEAAGRLAADYLVDLGHRRIGHIAGPASVVATIRDLSEAFVTQLERRGIRLASNMVVEGQLLVETGRFAAAELLRRDPKLTAIFSANDKMALGAYQAIREAGKVPGQDVAVIGCDDIPTAALADPPLTTVRMNYVEVGATGTRRLLEHIESNGTAEGLIFEKLPVALAVRQSCCRPPASPTT